MQYGLQQLVVYTHPLRGAHEPACLLGPGILESQMAREWPLHEGGDINQQYRLRAFDYAGDPIYSILPGTYLLDRLSLQTKMKMGCGYQAPVA